MTLVWRLQSFQSYFSLYAGRSIKGFAVFKFTPSNTINQVAPSATMVMMQAARDRIAAGHDVINLGAGEPDFDTPDHVKQAAIEALAQGKTKYTAVSGIPELKAAIARKFKRENNLDYTPDQITVAPGGKMVIYTAFLASLNTGDEVIVPTPCWVSYPEIVRLCGGTPVMAAGNAAFKLTPSALEAALSPRTKWLILNSPSNPTGAAYSVQELRALSEVLRAHPHVMILTDDIYEHLLYTKTPFATLAQVAPDLYARTLTMNGVSKAYAMTGWRIGYAGGPKALIATMAKVMGQTTSNPNTIAQWASIAALDGPERYLEQNRTVFQARRDLIIAGLNACSGLSCQTPDGAFYAFADCSQWLGRTMPDGTRIKSDGDVAQLLLKEAGVAGVPGSAFHAPGHIRFSYASDENSLQSACTRIQNLSQRLGL